MHPHRPPLSVYPSIWLRRTGLDLIAYRYLRQSSSASSSSTDAAS